MITVFTPSYNRVSELKLLYESLLKQDGAIFEWLIVDDGSTDETKDYINSLTVDNLVNIHYVYKTNGGKQSAYNLGLQEAKGNIFLCIDSDDVLADNILPVIESDFSKITDKNIAGIMYNQAYLTNKEKLIGTPFPKNNLVDSYYNIYHRLNVSGDKLIVFKTSVAREFCFPLIPGEKFIPEALIYNRISSKYNFVCRNKIAAYKEYLENGYSANYFSLVKKNPKGNALYYLELYTFEPTFYNVYAYLLFSFFAKEKYSSIIRHPSKIKVLLLYIPVFIISIVRR